jgi:hypothetical protein
MPAAAMPVKGDENLALRRRGVWHESAAPIGAHGAPIGEGWGVL